MPRNPFIGTWRLVSHEYVADNGDAISIYGPHPVGYLMYTDDGYMASAVMSCERPAEFQGIDRMLDATPEQQALAARTYMSYSGAYEIDGDKVIHHVQVALFPNQVGTDEVRYFTMRGNRLELRTTPFRLGGVIRTGRVIWDRAS